MKTLRIYICLIGAMASGFAAFSQGVEFALLGMLLVICSELVEINAAVTKSAKN